MLDRLNTSSAETKMEGVPSGNAAWEATWFVDVVTHYGPGCEHSVPLHVALEQCAEILDAKYIAVVDQNCPHYIGSENWLRILHNHRNASSVDFIEFANQRQYYLAFAEIKRIFSEFCELWIQTRSLLKSIDNNAACIIIYLDFANLHQKLAIGLSVASLAAIRKKCIVWTHFHRLGWHQTNVGGFVRYLLNILPIKIWGTAYTTEIAAENRKYSVVDIIPHHLNADVVCNHKLTHKKSDKLVCWLFITRSEQGLDLLPNMIHHKSASTFPKKFIKCFVSEKVGIKDNAEIELVRLPYLSQEDYRSHFNESEVVLLPYNANSFSCMMSGVFMEAVATRKIVIVSDGTVMASELRRFELGDLVMDFNNQFSWTLINEIRHDTSVLARVNLMAETYVREHDTFACAQSIYKGLKQIDPKMALSEPETSPAPDLSSARAAGTTLSALLDAPEPGRLYDVQSCE